MEYIFTETFVAQRPDNSGRVMRLAISVGAPQPHPDGGFQCELTLRGELGTWVSPDSSGPILGATPLRAIGQALLSVDSILDSRVHSHGAWTIESLGVTYDAKLHSAVPPELFAEKMASRVAKRKMAESMASMTEAVHQWGDLKRQELLRNSARPDG